MYITTHKFQPTPTWPFLQQLQRRHTASTSFSLPSPAEKVGSGAHGAQQLGLRKGGRTGGQHQGTNGDPLDGPGWWFLFTRLVLKKIWNIWLLNSCWNSGSWFEKIWCSILLLFFCGLSCCLCMNCWCDANLIQYCSMLKTKNKKVCSTNLRCLTKSRTKTLNGPCLSMARKPVVFLSRADPMLQRWRACLATQRPLGDWFVGHFARDVCSN